MKMKKADLSKQATAILKGDMMIIHHNSSQLSRPAQASGRFKTHFPSA